MTNRNRKPVVLIADDDAQLRSGLSARLVQSDFEVVCADCARTAMELFAAAQPDAAILDITMPDQDGLAICEYIRSTGSTIPVFILTGTSSGIIKDHLGKITEAVGANHFIAKPYDGKSLVLMLREAVQANACEEPLRRASQTF